MKKTNTQTSRMGKKNNNNTETTKLLCKSYADVMSGKTSSAWGSSSGSGSPRAVAANEQKLIIPNPGVPNFISRQRLKLKRSNSLKSRRDASKKILIFIHNIFLL